MKDKPKILVVDDEEYNLDLIEQALDGLEVDIFSFQSGIEAVQSAKEHVFALLILDVRMPDIDGYETLRSIKESFKNAETPAIFITAELKEEENILKGIKYGALDYITKPYNLGIFTGKVKHYIDIYKQKLELSTIVSKLEKTNFRLRENESKLRKITSVANEAIIVINKELEIIFWNKAAEKIFGYSEKEILTTSFKTLLPEDDVHQNFINDFIKVLTENKSKYIDLSKEIRAVKKNGLVFDADLSITSYLRGDSNKNAVWVLRDITKRKKVEHDLLKAKELKEANKVMREFMDNVSHELRTPMNAIIGISKMLSKYETDNLTEKQIEGLTMIYQSGNRLLNLINDVLNLSKIDSRKITIKNDEFYIEKLISNIKSTVISIIDKKPVKFFTKKSVRVPEYICADEQRITQVLINILGNAVKFTEKGRIDFNIHSSESKLFFEVSDTGIGIPQEHIKKIFKRFKQVDSSSIRKYQGTGLGLAISKELVELMGGGISIESEENIGTTVSLFVPYKELKKQPVYTEQPDKRFEKEEKNRNGTKRTALLIEDEVDLCYLYKSYLKKLNFRIEISHDGIEGYKKIQKLIPDIIFLDLNVPRMTGFDILKRMTREGIDSIPVIIMTASDYTPDRSQYEYFDILHKPIQLLDFQQVIVDVFKDTKPEDKKKILIAEDEEIGVYTYKMLLGDNYKLEFARNGNQVVDMFYTVNPDLVLMDIMMPLKTGIEALQEIKEKGNPNNIKIIAVTARATEEEKERILDCSFDDFISKPIDDIVLKMAIIKYLRK